MDTAKVHYRKKRIANWDQASRQYEKTRRAGSFYHKILQHYYRFLIPQGLRVLELGCGHGDLLASLEPSLGIGVDFSGEMIRRARVGLSWTSRSQTIFYHEEHERTKMRKQNIVLCFPFFVFSLLIFYLLP